MKEGKCCIIGGSYNNGGAIGCTVGMPFDV